MMDCFLVCLKSFILYPVVLLFIIYGIIVLISVWRKKRNKCLSIGFFHPYCNAGGGGERVLWVAVRAIQRKYDNVQCVIYSGDNLAADEIVKKVEQRFNIRLSRDVKIVHLRLRFWVEYKYPVLTLLLQSLGSVVLGFEALFKFVPDIYIDTMGYAFTFPIFKFCGFCRVGCYVHFPTISTDMLHVVKSRTVAVNNRKFISNNRFLSFGKIIYYRIFAFVYGVVGRCSEVIMVNSSWTSDHILRLWKQPNRTFTIYPPCDVSEFNHIPLDRHKSQKRMRVISIAQFRPEKNHQLQLKCFTEFLNRLGDVPILPQLVLIGSCRHEEDYKRVEKLRDLCKELGLLENVEFKLNLTFQDLMEEMTNSSAALHTMLNEHFGIGVVECMAAGLVTIAHDSGGPKMDIVNTADGQRTGFLAHDVATYADCLERILKLNYEELYKIRKAARESVLRFSDQEFENAFLSTFNLLQR